ncbi:hypothetical protein T440DRAFT_467788 [Plenodomus tracheiphilus IPT5]|uniref:Transcriptional activator HAP2 n=1 Tax=Plenodomus tracheiphilus IPT5 TaxID=1408161 RepID=A0A6A7B884_9PLEO|nr:hypothetical protein T440DRAFT_467788 [Plenodomus tracheiphilus IPT5]
MGEVATQNSKLEQVALAAGVNAKQHDRIMKRRLARQKLGADFVNSRNKQMQLTSHVLPHPLRSSWPCLRRARSPHGRFLAPEQLGVKELEKLSIDTGNEKHAQPESVSAYKSTCKDSCTWKE